MMAGQKRKICIICGNDTPEIISTVVRCGNCNVYRCTKCGLVFLDPLEASHTFNNFVSKVYDQDWSYKERLEKRLKTLGRTIDKINGFIEENSIENILEIGAGVGAAVYGLRQRNKLYKIDVIEPDLEAYDFLNSYFDNIKVHRSIDEIEDGKYGFVFGIQVFEHFMDPYMELNKIARISKKDTVLFLEFPNYDDFYKNTLKGAHFKNYEKFMFHSSHFYYFTIETFSKLIEKTRWRIENIETIQEYSVMNYFHWLLVGSNMKNYEEATKVDDELRELDEAFKEIVQFERKGGNISVFLKLR